MIRNLFPFCFFVFLISFCYSQEKSSLFKNYQSLSPNEKCWVFLHPLVANKALKISNHTLLIVQKIKTDTLLDGDLAGGCVDAFRHAFWMASLSKEINWRKALKLGIAHEKGNKKQFEKGFKEEGVCPDSAGMEMDLFNNRYGILLGKQFKKTTEPELIEMVIKAIVNGNLLVIKKDQKGNSLDKEGNIITGWEGQWVNKRVTVCSDYVREK